MSSTRSVKSPGIFANAASTVIPTTPIAGVSYRNAASGAAAIAQGWPYAIKVNSAEFNQILYQYASLIDTMDRQGILGWTNLVDYAVPAAVFGSDFKLYLCTNANGPATTVQDPVSAPAYWKVFDPAGFLSNLVNTPILDSAGSQRLGFASGGATSIQGQGSTPVNFKDAGGGVLGAFSSAGVLSSAADAVAASDIPRLLQVQNLVNSARATVGTAVTVGAAVSNITFTGISATARRITIPFRGLSLTGTSEFLFQLGTAGGFVTTGYSSYFGSLVSDTNAGTAGATNGIGMSGSNPASALQGLMTLVCVDPATQTWVGSHTAGETGTGSVKFGGGSIVLGAGNTLTQVRIVSANGTDNIDAGLVNTLSEG